MAPAPPGFLPMNWTEWTPVGEPPPQPFDALTAFRHQFLGAQRWINVQFDPSASWVRAAFLTTAPQTAQDQLLRHEQYHLLLAGALAAKAITAMRGGATQPATVWQQYQKAVLREGGRYDAATAHGTNATAQTAWETDIDKQNVVFP